MAGHIEKTNNGTYTIILEIGTDIYGKRIRKKKTFKTLADAKRALNEYENQMNKGTFVVPTDTRFGDWIKYWEENYVKNSLSETTYYGYKIIDDKYIIPCLGHIPLQNLHQDMLDAYYKYLHEDKKGPKLSANTVSKHHANISSALKFAMKKGKVFQNVAKLATIPIEKTKDKFEGSFYEANQIKELLRISNDKDIYLPICLAVYLGLSRSEICGITTNKVLLDKNIIIIDTARVPTGKVIVEKDPKAKSRNRIKYIPNKSKDILIKYVEENKAKEIQSGYLCTDIKGNPIKPDHISTHFAAILNNHNKYMEKKNDSLSEDEKIENILTRIRFHDLRHSNITLLIEQNANVYDVKEASGHSSIQTTMGYTHKISENQKYIAKLIDDILE